MRYRGVRLCVWPRGFTLNSSRPVLVPVVRFYSDVPNPNPKSPEGNSRSGAEVVKERTLTALQNASALGRQWGQSSAQTASATVNYWWNRYEEFVGINEVREAQTKVTQAEADFMVSRSAVREAHVNVEALQLRLKEVRERLDRVSREEPHYLELATIEHKLLQEDRRLRTAYELAEGSEREKFSLFSAAVRESHEKERTRAERTKNWSIFGSVLGALIGVMGSTYVNRVRLQELKTLLLEAQKGPESLQEALRIQAGNHRAQQDELGALIDRMSLALHDFSFTASTQTGPSPQNQAPNTASESNLVLKDLSEGQKNAERRLSELKRGLDSLHNDVSAVKTVVETQKGFVKTERTKREQVKGGETVGLSEMVLVKSLEETQRTLSDRIRANTLYNAVFVYTASAVTVSLLFLLLKGGAS